MITYITFTIAAFTISALCGFIFIPIILNFCKKRNLYDIPNSRKVHKNAIPRLGGISFLPSMLVSFVIVISLLNFTDGTRGYKINLWSIYFMLGVLLIYGVGIVDDLIGLPATPKFIVQILAACFLPLSGLYINNFYGFFGIWNIPFYIGCPLTVFIIVFINNSMNLIDGIDGLAAGLTEISLLGFLYVFALQGLWFYVMLIAGLIGVLIPYLYFNLFGKVEDNRKIFMGDSGSLTLGFILSFLFVKYSMNNPQVMPFRKDGLLLAYTLLIIPTFDVVRVIFVRIWHRRPIFDADKNHIHHKLLRTGMNQHQVLFAILAFALFYIIINIVLNQFLYTTEIIVIDTLLYIIAQMIMDRILKKSKSFV